MSQSPEGCRELEVIQYVQGKTVVFQHQLFFVQVESVFSKMYGSRSVSEFGFLSDFMIFAYIE
jgi:hypothetical protein